MNKELEEALAGIPISFDLVETPKVMHNVELIKSALERLEKIREIIKTAHNRDTVLSSEKIIIYNLYLTETEFNLLKKMLGESDK